MYKRQRYDLIAFSVVYVHDLELKTFEQIWRQKQSAVVHGIAKCQIQRQIEGARIGLVGGKKQKGLAFSFLEFHFGDAGSQSPYVARKGILEQVLSGSVQSLLFGYISGSLESIPGRLMYERVISAIGVGHEDCYVISGEGKAKVDYIFAQVRF